MEKMIWSPTLHLFALCAAILVMKMLMTGYATSVLRNVRRVYLSPEDYAFWGREPGPPDPQIERIRRAHQNDLEAVLPFLVIGFLAASSGTVSYEVAWWLFVPFTVARILHTIAYAFRLQPWRSVLFGIADVALLATTTLLLIALV